MNTLPPRAQNDNPQKQPIVYALIEPVEQPTWIDVRYIGMSTNVQYRFQQHLACRSDDSNEDKNEWILGILAKGKLPLLRELERLESIEQGRAREQHWIRYAMAQGAKLLNRAITYTEEERLQIHAERTVQYAKIEGLFAQGVYVKRAAYRYPSSVLERYRKRILDLLDAHYVFFQTTEGITVSVDQATNEEFDTFIRQYIPVIDGGVEEWPVAFDRVDAVNFAYFHGKVPMFCAPPPDQEKPTKKTKQKDKAQSFRVDHKRLVRDGVVLSQYEGITLKLSVFNALELADWLEANRRLLEELL